MRRCLVLITVVCAAAAAPANGDAALFFLFDRPTAAPNDRVTVRTGVTSPNFRPVRRARGQPVRLYLVRSDFRQAVRSRFDERLEFVGSFVPDARGRGTLSFALPALDPGTYDVAYWCRACARYSNGRTFGVQDADTFREPFRSQSTLRIAPSIGCPVTRPFGAPPRDFRGAAWYGNGVLGTTLPPDGVLVPARHHAQPDGSLFWKFGWIPTGVSGSMTLKGRRLDAPSPPLKVLGINWGYSSTGRGSWATAVLFPSAGCWRLSARVADIALTYVINVVRP